MYVIHSFYIDYHNFEILISFVSDKTITVLVYTSEIYVQYNKLLSNILLEYSIIVLLIVMRRKELAD